MSNKYFAGRMRRTRNWSAACAIIFCVFILCVPALGDDSAMAYIDGGMVAPLTGHPTVRMVSETVTVRLTEKAAKVHCQFEFRNEDKKCLVNMGFPARALSGGDGGAESKLTGFRSWVDGKPVKCRYKPGKIVEHIDTRSQTSWYMKEVPFDAGQTRTVVDEYSTDLGSSSTAGDSAYETSLSFSYILKTGRNWKGPIGRAGIIVDTSGISTEHYEIAPSPKGFVLGKKTVTWTFTNFEPKDDIGINLIPHFPTLNGKETDDYLWSPFTRVRGVTMTGVGFLKHLGAVIEYPNKHGYYLIKYNGHTLKLLPKSTTAVLDGAKITLQAALSEEYTFVQIPTASVVRALGGEAHYNQTEHRLLIKLPDRSKRKH